MSEENFIEYEKELDDIVSFEEPIDVFTSDDLDSLGEIDYQLIDDDIERLEKFLEKEDSEEW